MRTEKEKMLSGELYNPFDSELSKERYHAKQALHAYNKSGPADAKEQRRLIKELFGTVGKQYQIEQPFFCDYGYNIHIGAFFFSNYNCTILDVARVTIGDNVMFGPNVGLYTVNHPLNAVRRNTGLEYAKPVTIGNNVWVGGHSVILPGVTIGENSVIGAGSVVTKDIPANVVAVGNPCKVLRPITEEDV